MFRKIALATLAAALALPAYAAPPDKGADKPFVFIGFSMTTTDGGAGLPGMNAICQSDFGRTDSRMATTKEYIESTNAVLPFDSAWIHPYPVGGTSGVVDFSTTLITGNANCGGWASNDPGILGLVVFTDGSVRWGGVCNQSNIVACSARAN